jgi:anti-sigma B factor antagonist
VLQDRLTIESAAAGRFSLEVTPDAPRVTITPRGELDLATRDQLRSRVGELVEDGFAEIVLDLRVTSFIDSSGLAAILGMDEASRAGAYALSLIEGPPEVQRLFELSGLRSRLPFVAVESVAHRPAA